MFQKTRRSRRCQLHPSLDSLEGRALLNAAMPLPGNQARVSAEVLHTKHDRGPDLGDYQNLQVPAGNEVAFHLYGVGVQIYSWTGTSWSFVSPEAVLYAHPNDHGVVAFHYAGPTWQSLSGSKVGGTTIQSSTPNPEAIPWLLLQATSHEGHGILQRVTFVQRLYTEGGVAPTTPGDSPGQVTRVPYTAEYFFYRPDH
jgi:Protein of unknown function (DUF3455)